jgi:hypothetical protein
MKTFALPSLLAQLLVPSALGLVACTTSEDAPDLESANGGLTLDDEAPAFGDEAGLAAAAIEPDAPYADPMESDPAVAAAREAPDGVAYRAIIVWGQMPASREVAAATDWSGGFALNRGALVVRRTIGFEDATDGITPRTDRASVAFTSATRPASDGLVIAVFDPTPDAAEALTLTYTPATGAAVTVEVEALTTGRSVLVADDLGNRMVAAAVARTVDVCDRGFLRGRWHVGPDGNGVFLGVVTDDDMTPVGHVRGVHGTRRNGEQVFFGKFIGLAGRFRGIFAGRYRDGAFGGLWRTRALDAGSLAGDYTIGEDEGEGSFVGTWAERRCNVALGPDDAPL